MVDSMIEHKVTQVKAGWNHSLCLTDEGVLYGCGRASDGQLGLGDTDDRKEFTEIVSVGNKKLNAIYAGGAHSWLVVDERDPVIISRRSKADYVMVHHGVEVEEVKEEVASPPLQLNLPKFQIQVIYTDTTLSHRFIRFQIA